MKTTKMNTQTTISSLGMNAPKSISKMLVLSLLFMLLGFSSFAKSEISSKEKETTEIRKQLYSQIQFPGFMKEKKSGEESVNVVFCVDKNGNIKVMKTDSKNESLNKFIVAEMENAKLESLKVNEENIYKINIHFKLL